MCLLSPVSWVEFGPPQFCRYNCIIVTLTLPTFDTSFLIQSFNVTPRILCFINTSS